MKSGKFVWIPVTENYDRNTTYEVVEVSTSAYTDIDYLPEGIQPTIPEKITEPENIGKINEEAERQAVRLKGGFYISRYEAGKDINDNLISRKGAEVWLNKKQKEFKDLGKTFEIKNNTKVKSAMCSGIQWDMIMKFITENDEDYDVLNGNQNWHMGSSVSLTGENDEDEGCNIYDLESNAYEYVAEKSSYYNSYGTYPFVIRGGLYEVNSPASVRLYSNDVADDYTSFRFVIYII